jgi:hypothetical protein
LPLLPASGSKDTKGSSSASRSDQVLPCKPEQSGHEGERCTRGGLAANQLLTPLRQPEPEAIDNEDKRDAGREASIADKVCNTVKCNTRSGGMEGGDDGKSKGPGGAQNGEGDIYYVYAVRDQSDMGSP